MSATVAAAEGDYLRFGVLAGFSHVEDLSTQGTVGTGEPLTGGPFAGQPDGFLIDPDIDDLTATVELGAGRRFGAWVVDVGYEYRYRTDVDVTAATASLDRPSQFHVDVETHLVDVQLLRYVTIAPTLDVYAGAGAGIVYNLSGAEFLVRAAPGIPETRSVDETGRSDLTWNLQSGIVWRFAQGWSVEARYRYVDLGSFENEPFDSTGVRFSGDEYVAHDLLIGMRIEF